MAIKDARIQSRAGAHPIRSAARIAVVACGLTVCAFAQPAEFPNLVANGDFSAVTGGKPDKWEASGNRKDVDLALNAAKDERGKPCAQLVCTRCDHASLVTLRQAGGTPLDANRVYELSCRMRAESLQSGTVDVAFEGTQGWLFGRFTERVYVPRFWQEYSLPLRPERDAGATGRVEFRIAETGKLWVSDVRIYELPAPAMEFTETVTDAGARNLLVNGSFELGESHWSSLGVSRSWSGGLSELHGSIQPSGGAHGRSFLRIPLGGERTPLVCFDYYQPVVRREIRPLAASLGWVPVVKGTPYTLSCDMRASKEGVRAMLAAHSEAPDAGASDYSKDVTLTTQWQRYSFTFKPEQRYAFVMVGPDLIEEDRVDVDVGAVQLEKGDQATAWTPRTPVEFAIEPAQPAGIFTEGEPASLILCAANDSEAAVQAPARLSVTDFDDKPVAVPEVSLSIPPRSTVRSELKLPADWKGYYRIRGSLDLPEQPDLADLRIAVVPKRTSNDSVCGINHAFPTDRLIQLASKAGATWYRDWSLRWQSIEPAKGQFHWEAGDAQIDRVLRQGCHVVPLLPPFPSADWSSEAPVEIATEGYPGMRLRQGWAPRDPNDLANYVEKSVEHYKDRIRVYEFLNEPLFTNYALPADAGDRFGGEKEYTAADYVALLAAASRAMKAADPNCKIIAGMSSGPGGFRNNEIIQAGCLKYADYFNIHIYPGRRPPERFIPQMDAMLAFMDKHGGRKPIWLTEFSYYAADELPRKPFTGGQDPWAGATLLPDERQCAQLTVRFFAIMLSHGVEKIFFHSGASGIANGPQFDCAFFGYGGAPRRLFPALAVLTELLGDKPASAGYRRLGNTGHAAAFDTDRQAVLILWEAENGPNSALSEIPESVRFLDMIGREIAARPVKLSSSPVYLLGAPGRAKELLDSLQVPGAKTPRAAPWYETLRPGVTRAEILQIAGSPTSSGRNIDTYAQRQGRIECKYEHDSLLSAVYYNPPGGAKEWTLYATNGGDLTKADLAQRKDYLKGKSFIVLPQFSGRNVYTHKYRGACYEVEDGFILIEPIIDLGGGEGYFNDKAARVRYLKADGTEEVLYRAADHWASLKPPGLTTGELRRRQSILKDAGKQIIGKPVEETLGRCDSHEGSGVDYQLFCFDDGLAVILCDYRSGAERISDIRIVRPGLGVLSSDEYLPGANPGDTSKAAP